MTTRKARQTDAALSTTGMTSLLLLGAWCGAALASTEIPAPCPEPGKQTEASLHEILDGDKVTSPNIRTIDSSDVATPPPLSDTASEQSIDEHDSENDHKDAVSTSSELPAITARLPGISSSELPRFRRHMFRTDI